MKYRKKPVVIDAFKWTGDINQEDDPAWIVEAVNRGDVAIKRFVNKTTMLIVTLEGNMTAYPGDWIIRGVKGEIYPCRDDIFEATYELAEKEKE